MRRKGPGGPCECKPPQTARVCSGTNHYTPDWQRTWYNARPWDIERKPKIPNLRGLECKRVPLSLGDLGGLASLETISLPPLMRPKQGSKLTRFQQHTTLAT